MGLVTPLGNGVDATWQGVLEGRTGIECHEQAGRPENLQFFGRIAGLERPTDIPRSLASQVRFLNRGSKLGFEAARQAIGGADIDLSSIPRERRSLFLASGDLTMAGCEFMHPAFKDAARRSAKSPDYLALNRAVMSKVNPFFLLESICNNLFSFVSAAFEFMGPNTCLASLSPCGAHTVELAARKVCAGQADVALALGCGCWISEIPMFEMQGLGILSRCNHGAASFRPLDRARDGFIPGEGAAAILIEDGERAQARGARILAEIKGLGNCLEFPGGKGLSVPEQISKSSMLAALEEGAVDVQDLAFICPHGSGTRKGDRSELNSIAEIMGARDSAPSVCALKAYTGHMGAASDVSEIILGIVAINDGVIPGTLNFSEAERAFAGMKISSKTREAKKTHFLSVSYGIIGQCSSVLVEGRACRT
jgi:3-oxoacyl-[acyl-carrier-protein] synthase II